MVNEGSVLLRKAAAEGLVKRETGGLLSSLLGRMWNHFLNNS